MELTEEVINILRDNKTEFDYIEKNPNSDNPCYELVEKIIESYSNVDIDNIKFNKESKPDIDIFLYSIIIEGKCSKDRKKEKINSSSISADDKQELCKFIDEHKNIGIFGTGQYNFGNKFSESLAKDFIKTCISIKNEQDKDKTYKAVDTFLKKYLTPIGNRGQIAILSEIFHCIKPKQFPIINTNDGFGTLYSECSKKVMTDNYIDNCKRISDEIEKFNEDVKQKNIFHDFLGYSNYRIFDSIARLLGTNFDEIATFFKEYGNQKYRKEDKDKKEKGQKAAVEFDKFLKNLKLIDNFKYQFSKKSYIHGDGNCYCSNYFWGQIKNQKYSKEPYSITVAVNLDKNNELGLYVKTEISDKDVEKVENTKKEIYVNSFAKSTTNIPNGFVLEKNNIKNTEYEKTNIIKKIDLNHDQTVIIQNTQDAINSLIPNYNAIFSDDSEPPTGDDTQNGNNGEDDNMNTQPAKNQILYGPPGTGKTYNTVVEAMKIIDKNEINYDKNGNVTKYPELKKKFDEYKKQGRIEFVTFHQSYSYEEFVEGIKPYIPHKNWVMNDDDISDEDDKNVKYIGKQGIFRQICDRALTPVIKKITNDDYNIGSNSKIWKVSLMGTGDNPIRRYCMENECIRIGFDKYGETITDETVFDEGGSRVLNAFIYKMDIGDIVLSCFSDKTIDAVGVITGDYEWNDSFKEYKRVRKVKWLIKNLNYNILEINNGTKLTLATVYQLYIPIKTVIDIINSKNNLVKFEENKDKYVLIIDEINRGNISKIFGELITLIEPDKRLGEKHGLKVKLPYSQEEFGVPQNLYIIGTMNTADRSIASVDIALRRRFKFVEMMPKPELLRKENEDKDKPSPWQVKDEKTPSYNIDLEKLLETLNKRISILADPDHQIGHSYFMNLIKEDENGNKPDFINEQDLKDVFKYEILPLLNEYFYGDWEKIKAVLIRSDYDTVINEPINTEKEKEVFKQSLIEEIKPENLFCAGITEATYKFNTNIEDFKQALNLIGKGIIS